MTYTQPQSPVPPRQPMGGPAVAPPAIKNAQMAMYGGAGLTLLSMISGLVTKNRVLDDFRRTLTENGESITDINNRVDSASTLINSSAVGGSIVGILLWILMAWANGKGQKWARIVATVLFAINTIATIATFFGSPKPHWTGLILNVLIWLAGLAAIYYLYRKEASDFFNRGAALAR